MDNIYVTCARCNKGMNIAEYNCVFCSDIDNQIVCADCYKKEQPKELMKQIADIEAKILKFAHRISDQNEEILELKQQLAESERKYEDRKQFCITETRSLTEIINNLLEENTHLNNQLFDKEKEETKRMEDFEKRCQEYYSTDEYKRDFAIAELEKVLCFMRQKDSMGFSPSFRKIKEQIREQIKTMKGE